MILLLFSSQLYFKLPDGGGHHFYFFKIFDSA